ncbi:hypothetical protein B296_00012225 [Ensete ventricosum]|uniref:Uncharacterized protein n=1 Tax=Ensete ventricosum TaxID=4639 RepID=A0A427AN84_ENSVE|nr:hypothetical protein B296_00012225 [Ensete ventricosum]
MEDFLIGEYDLARYFLAMLNLSEEYKRWEKLKNTLDDTLSSVSLEKHVVDCDTVQRKPRQYPSDHTQVSTEIKAKTRPHAIPSISSIAKEPPAAAHRDLPTATMALDDTVIAGINFLAVLLSVPVIAIGIWLAMQTDNSCVQLLQWPVIAIGIVILLVGLAGFVGAFWRMPRLLLFYLVAMLVVILLLGSLVIFIYAVTVNGSGHPAPNRAYLEYRLEDYSGWLRRRVEGSYKWNRIKKCLSSTTVCAELNQTYRLAEDFFSARMMEESGRGAGGDPCGPYLRLRHGFLRFPERQDGSALPAIQAGSQLISQGFKARDRFCAVVLLQRGGEVVGGDSRSCRKAISLYFDHC